MFHLTAMVKCHTCKDKQASLHAPNGGAGRFCKLCSANIPGAVPRYRKDKEANSISLNALPIPADALGNSPRIVVTMDSDWLEQRAPAATLLLAASNRRTFWGPNITQVLDCSTGTQQHEQMAESIGRELYENYDTMSPVLQSVAQVMSVNGTACFGLNKAGHVTLRHSHAPMGVLNLLMNRASKVWNFWPPGDDSLQSPQTCTQGPGDVIWIPPGWQHEVTTTGGSIMQSHGDKYVVALHWSCWCLPKKMAMRSLCALLTGITAEHQRRTKENPRPLTKKQQKELYVLLDAYAP